MTSKLQFSILYIVHIDRQITVEGVKFKSGMLKGGIADVPVSLSTVVAGQEQELC